MNRKEKALIIAIGANLLLIALKFFLASLSGSIALKASAWHSFSDLVPSVIVFMGLILARREDRTATRGISRIENGVAIVVAFFIFYVGYEVAKEVVFGEARPLSNVLIVAVMTLLSIAITYFMARYQIYVGREENSPGLVANGTHARVDMYSSIVVLIALVGATIGFAALDKIAAAVIVFLIATNGLEVLTSSLRALRSGGMFEFTHRMDELPLSGALRFIRRYYLLGIPVALLIYIASGLYTIQWNEVGMVKRFGRPVRTVEPGVHFRLPRPIESVDKVQVATMRKERIPLSLMLTGDENLVELEAVVHYQVKDPFQFLYYLSDHRELVVSTVESALREIINGEAVDRILTDGKTEIQQRSMDAAQRVLDEQEAGIRLTNVQLTTVAPPSGVMEAFRDVASAREDKNTYINEAVAYQAEVVPKARGEAARLIEEARGYREEKIRRARGDAVRFLKKHQEYRKNRDITEIRLYIETLEAILPGVDKFILDKSVNVDNTELWFLKGKLSKDILRGVQR